MFGLWSGEDSGKVMIWNMAPVLREEDEKNESIPKMLCQMDNHLGKTSPLKGLLSVSPSTKFLQVLKRFLSNLD